MDKKELTFICIDHVNILSLVLSMAKHQIGEISDEAFKKEISDTEMMLSQARKRATVKALEDLLGMTSKETEEQK